MKDLLKKASILLKETRILLEKTSILLEITTLSILGTIAGLTLMLAIFIITQTLLMLIN